MISGTEGFTPEGFTRFEYAYICHVGDMCGGDMCTCTQSEPLIPQALSCYWKSTDLEQNLAIRGGGMVVSIFSHLHD